MPKFSRSDVRQFFQDTIREKLNESSGKRKAIESTIQKYKADHRTWRMVKNEFEIMADGGNPDGIRDQYYPGWTNLDFHRVLDALSAPSPYDLSDEPDAAEIRRRTSAYREENPPDRGVVNFPTQDEFDAQLRQRRAAQRLSRQKLREMIGEAIRFGYHDAEGGERSEFYDEADFMDPDDPTMVIPPAGDREYAYLDPSMEYSIDDSTDVMDSDLDLYGDPGSMERAMMGQGRYPKHHHDDDYSDLGDLDMLGDDLDTYNSGDDLVMEGQTSTGTSAESLKKLVDYLSQQGIKFSPFGIAIATHEIGDKLIDKITRGDLEGAAKMFTDRYGRM